jgi:hypothetical protein
VGQREILTDDFLLCQTGSRVALANAGVCLITFLAQHGGTDATVTDVRLCAETFYSRGVAAADANVVKHGCLLNKTAVHAKFGVGIANLQCALAYQFAVGHEDVAQFIIVGVIPVNYFLIIHLYNVSYFVVACKGTTNKKKDKTKGEKVEVSHHEASFSVSERNGRF